MLNKNEIIQKIKFYFKRILPFFKNKKNIILETNGCVLTKSNDKHFYFHRTLCQEVSEFCKNNNNIEIHKILFISSFDTDLFKNDSFSEVSTQCDSYVIVSEENGINTALVYMGNSIKIK